MRKSNLRKQLVGGAAAGAIALALGAPAWAQEATYDFNQPSMEMAAAIQAVGHQTGANILVDSRLVSGLRSPELKGELSTDQALLALLDGTGLTMQRTDKNSILIRSAADPQSGSAAGDGADSGTVQALIVTAQKREEDIQDVPIAISAFTQEDLTRSQVAGGPDLMTQVPNFTFTKTNFTSYSIQIRGIGTQAISATTDPAVAVAFNNTSFLANHFFEQEFYDLERVEVLRGPQGTLYGRNATAGVVNLISAKPVNHYEARLSGDVSNYNSSRLEGMMNIPLIDGKAALRVAGAWTKRDGYVKNTLTGQQTDGRDLWSTRVTLGLTPTDALSVNLIWEHFAENDDRLRSGKQMCHRDSTENTYTTQTQGCLPASLYSPDSFETPNGYALGYWGGIGTLGGAPDPDTDPYASHFQSRNLREIETRIVPEYDAKADTVELQAKIDLPYNLSLSSETGLGHDFIFSFEDYNRFNTAPHTLVPGTHMAQVGAPRFDIVDENGVYCDPQLGCSDRLMAGDLATARSKQFSQEFRLSSDFDGPFNFNVGANFLRYDTEVKYYVFINTITSYFALDANPWMPGVSDNMNCVARDFYGPVVANPDTYWSVFGCAYIDPNNIHHLNDNGRNYFLSKNPYHLLSYAAFGEAYYNITSNLKLTAGLRWTVDKKTAPEIPTWLLAGPWGPDHNGSGSSWGLPTRKVLNQEWREPTGRISLDWKPKLSFTDETLVYGSYTRGYKAGGANPPPPVLVLATICPPECTDGNFGFDLVSGLINHYITHPETFKPEFVNAYEVGTKNTLLEGRLTANLAAFYYDYTGYQISYIVDRSAVNLNYDAKIWGGELEVDWRPLENLRLGFKGGYENTRLAKGMKAIDLMDRTAGHAGWVVKRPFPTMPSNCVFPTWVLQATLLAGCEDYITGVDPATLYPYVPNPTQYRLYPPPPPGYPGYDTTDPANANYGQGFYKDVSGHQLPNAPKFTATITADYTLPLPNSWLATLHTDLYYQSEAWTRIFNTPGYDKLKAYSNINLAAIFSNQDEGWQVMAYVKNVLNKDNITGAFLNSDDTGLTTNVFLNEPRLYGIRVTRNWSGGEGWIARSHTPGGPYPVTVEFGAAMERLDSPAEAIAPFAAAFSHTLDKRGAQQGEDLDWTQRPELRLTYQPAGSPWKVSAAVRYGRTSNQSAAIRGQEIGGSPACDFPTTDNFGIFAILGKLRCDPSYGPGIVNGYTVQNKYDPSHLATPINRIGASFSHLESHTLADFAVGREVGLGLLGSGGSSLSLGLRYADFKSSASGDMTGIPDMIIPDFWAAYPTTFHHDTAAFEARREFKGMGPTLSWEVSKPLLGNDESGRLDVDWAVAGGALVGDQKTTITGTEGTSSVSVLQRLLNLIDLPPVTLTPIDVHRGKTATVPVVDLSLGLSYGVSGVKLSTGYRWERYFNVLDGGFEQHKSYDRTIDGPYFKVSVGFGG